MFPCDQIQILHFRQECQGRDVVFFSVYLLRRPMKSVCLIPGDVNLDRVVQVVPARFLHCKVCFPFCNEKVPGGEML